jgi:hypothetical protein
MRIRNINVTGYAQNAHWTLSIRFNEIAIICKATGSSVISNRCPAAESESKAMATTTLNTTTTEEEIKTALSRDAFYGQNPVKVVVPAGYVGAAMVNGITVETSQQAKEPYIVPAEGGKLGFDGKEIEGSESK